MQTLEAEMVQFSNLKQTRSIGHTEGRGRQERSKTGKQYSQGAGKKNSNPNFKTRQGQEHHTNMQKSLEGTNTEKWLEG